MEKNGFEDVAMFVCESISKNKRFSQLSHSGKKSSFSLTLRGAELCDLWKAICKYLAHQLNLKKVRAHSEFVTKKVN